MTVTLGIVTGTYNRLASLQRFIASARREIPRGLSYRITLVDGGSTDGTIQWCKQQSDIDLIEHGELRGAIKSFCEGASKTDAEYILLGNDDVELRPYSLIGAISHLERNRGCAVAAFADNRTSSVTGDGTEYRVEGIGATLHTGVQTMVPYAQVGLFRKELGDQAGWWGADDPIMGKARTYGGDNYLSARLWEMGYTVDAVDVCQVTDHIARDDLRTWNASIGGRDSAAYYERFPTVHIPRIAKQVSARDRLRILHLPVYEWGHPQRKNLEAGLTEALTEYGLVIEIDYLNEVHNLVNLVKAWRPDLLLLQVQGSGNKLSPYKLATMRSVCPEMTVINWNGDIHTEGLIGDEVLKILRYVDLQLTVNAKVLPEYGKLGIKAAYHQIYFKEPILPLPEVPSHEVVWSANCYDDRRSNLLLMLKGMRLSNGRHIKLGAYGNCKNADGNCHYDFAMQAALYKNAKIVIGDTFPGGYGFVSNRLFQVIGNGGFLLQEYSPGLDELTGLRAGEHYAQWQNNDDLKRQIEHWLKPENDEHRKRIAQCGSEFVQKHYSASAQAKKLFQDLIPLIQSKYP